MFVCSARGRRSADSMQIAALKKPCGPFRKPENLKKPFFPQGKTPRQKEQMKSHIHAFSSFPRQASFKPMLVAFAPAVFGMTALILYRRPDVLSRAGGTFFLKEQQFYEKCITTPFFSRPPYTQISFKRLSRGSTGSCFSTSRSSSAAA